MATQEDSGTADVTLDTPMTLFTSSATPADKSYGAKIDTEQMVAGDRVVITVKTKSISTATVQIVINDILTDAQDIPQWYLPPIFSPHASGFILIVEQTDGTARDFNWSVFSV